ncbi:cilium assembly protein DZIP1L-like isoform X3 [Halichondria panicea]|uniref:cilium assembly protein DZIP1L-like isoform X3 n=1 Tax=Halichondria panicea TaxID=6063 RepID=UPI00312B6948
MNGHPSMGQHFGSLSGAAAQTNAAHGTTFAFRKRWGQIDWRSLASVDVDRIAREMDFQSLQQNIMNVTFCNIESEEFHNVDHNFTKLFRLAQLIIEYLLHCQQYLSEQATEFEQKVQENQQELEKAKSDVALQTTEFKTLKKENRKRKKIIQAYQDMLNSGATGIHSCPVCKREFVSKEYLQSHIHRRHPDHSLVNGKEGAAKSVLSQEELEKKLMEQMTEKLQATETQLKEEMHKKELEAQQKQVDEFEHWKAKEQERMKLELHAFKEPILSELRAAQQEKAQLEQVLLQKQADIEALMAKKPSHLGHLEGAQELDIHGSRRRQAEMEQVKQQLELKVDELQSSMKKQEKSWQKKLQKMSTSYQDQIDGSTHKLSVLEQGLQESALSKEKDKAQSSLEKQLSSLKKKVKGQEEQLHSHRQELSVLNSRDPSPTPLRNSPVRVLEYPPTVRVQEDYSESESGSDEVDSPQHQYYTPLPHRPMIKTNFAHSPEMLANMKRETESILSGALQQRGLPQGLVGLSENDFAAKMKLLEQERQQRIQTSYNFVEHRDHLVQEVDDISRSDFVRDHPKHSRQKEGRNKGVPTEQADLAVSLTGTNRSKPPLPTNTRLSSSQQDPARSSGSPARPSKVVHTSPAHQTPATRVELQRSPARPSQVIHISPAREAPTTRVEPQRSESESEEESLTSLTASPQPPRPLVTTSAGLQDNDSPWDSSDDDSIEALAAPQSGGRTSSTPIKGGGIRQKIPPPQASMITIEPNLSKKPVGGVPVFQVPSMYVSQDEDDSFDISEPSFQGTTVTTSLKGTNLKTSLPRKDSTPSVNPISRTATSRSALTTVSVDDFADSDFSDLDL